MILNRRALIHRAVLFSAATGLSGALSPFTARAQGRKGGLFRAALGQGASTDSLDPATWGTNYYTSEFGSIAGNSLTEVDTRNSIVPGLAESFVAEDGARKWVFKLRKGVTFHNGKALSADDVVASINYHRGEDSKSGSKPGLAIVDDIKADGPETVIITLKNGSPDFPYETSSYRLAIFPSMDGKINAVAGGTGPYMITRFDPGVILEAKRNPNYFAAAEPFFDAIELRVVADATARTNALVSGEVDYIDRCDLRTIGMLAQNSDFEIDNVTGFSHLVATINTTIPPFNDNNVRLALKYAIDREELLKKILYGYGTVGNDNPFAPTLKFATNPEPIHHFDPAVAKSFLKKAGLDSLKIDLSTSTAAFEGAVDAAALIKESAAKCGIEINIVTESADSYWDNVWLKKPFMLSYWGGRPTIDQHATQAYAADAPWNDTFWKDPHFNELLMAARSEIDEARRAAIYAEMQQMLHDDGGQIVLMFNNYVNAHSKRVGHGELNSNLDHDGTYMWRRWWFNA
jgi:peptide/nickel transport system substrate-binding protein